MYIFLAILLAFVALILVLSNKAKNSANVVITGQGVLKTHDVECKFRSEAGYHGDLDQSRWSDGQERLLINLRKLPGRFSGPVRLTHNGSHVADLDAVNGRIDFGWKGQADTDNPKFEIGDEVMLVFGGHELVGTVEAD